MIRATRENISKSYLGAPFALDKINSWKLQRVRKLRDEALKFTAMRARGSFSTPSRKVMLLNDNDGLDALLLAISFLCTLCAAADEVRI
jgi:hypothetical protein